MESDIGVAADLASVSRREAFWPGLPDGFDVVERGAEFVLVLRAEVAGIVLAGAYGREALMSVRRARSVAGEVRATAVARTIALRPVREVVLALQDAWHSHVAACVSLGIPSRGAGLSTRIKATESDSLDRLPQMLSEWRAERVRLKQDEELAAQIVSTVQIDQYGALFPAAARRRRFVAVLGPTNSGKTHLALEHLAAAHSGFYAGPLRLLALECYDRLNSEFGTPCALLTGEERRDVEGARHVSCTVEMVSPTRRVEVAVIDEVQMITDPQRGWAWTQAIAAADADVVYLLGTLAAKELLHRLAERLGVDLEVKELERLSPLRVADQPLGSTPRGALRNVLAGDCLVVFTRRDCLLLRDELVSMGREVACLYGALSPEARQAQADRFTSGAAEIIVATDAIGMGLNLRGLRRVVLVAAKKFDGQMRSGVSLDLVRQICGRAGRYGHTDSEAGVVLGLTDTEHRLVRAAFSIEPEATEVDRFPVAPSGEVLKKLAESTGEHRLAVLLQLFLKHCAGGGYKAQLPGDSLDRAYLLDDYDLPVETRFLLSQVPVPTREREMQCQWIRWVRAVAAQGSICSCDFVSVGGPGSLAAAEREVQLLNGYLWLCMKLPTVFVEEALARGLVRQRSADVTKRLKSRQAVGESANVERFGSPSWYWSN